MIINVIICNITKRTAIQMQPFFFFNAKKYVLNLYSNC